MEQAGPNPSKLDRPGARFVAAAVFLSAALALAWIHRDDLFPPQAAARAADDPVAQCLAARAKDIDQMFADGVIGDDQVAQFKSRAEALCIAQEGQGR